MSNFDDSYALADKGVKFIFSNNITSNTTTSAGFIDTKNSASDVFWFKFILQNRTDGTYTPLIEYSDDGINVTGSVADIDLRFRKVEGDDLNYIDVNQESEATLSANAEALIGVRYRARYVKFSIVSTGVTTGAKASVIAVYKPSVIY
jgi:hypothetical protein